MTDLRNVVYIIGAALLLCVAAIAAIAGFTDRPVPDVLQNIAVGSLTGLVGLLVPTSSTGGRRRRNDTARADLLYVLWCVVLALAAIALLVWLA